MESPPTERATQASPPGAGAAGPWGWLELSYSDRHNGLVAALVSVTQDGEHSLRSVLNWVGGSASDGWYWRADATRNTLIGILNADTEEARVQVSLDFYSGGQKRSYQLPERRLAARSAELVDVAAVLGAGQPDPDGDLIPAGVTTGGYRVQKVGPRLGQVLTTEGLLVDRQRKSFESIYHTCCALTNVKILPSFLEIPFQQSGEITVTAFDLCTFQTVSIAESAEFLSSNPAVADVGGGGGEVFGAGGGTATVHTEVNYFEYTCTPASSDKDTATTVMQPQVSCTPSSLTRGLSTTCTASVLNAPQGATIEFSNWRFVGGGGTVNRGTSGSSTWGGTMVTSGTVSVDVKVNNNPIGTPTAAITVNSRNWHTTPATASQVPNGTFVVLPVPPQPTAGDSGLGAFREQTGNLGFSHTVLADNGPNHGYAYYATQPTISPKLFQYTINPDLENSGSAFSQQQCGNYNASTNPSGFISWTNLITQTRRHEYNSTTQSHHAFYKNAMNLASNNPGDFVESRVAPPGANLATFAGDTSTGLNNRYAQIGAASGNEVGLFAVNESQTGIFLGNINFAPYSPCN